MVVRDRGPIGAILLVVTILSLLSILLLIFLVWNGRGNVVLVAIPGFPLESVVAGLLLGVFLVALKRSGQRATET